jgi:GT2 family glycosyltransferase
LLSCSIVIPTRNRKDDLQELLQSILKQAALPKEVIVVDDSEDESTKDLIKKTRNYFTRKGIPLNYLRGNEHSRSISAARNKGASVASGDVICFLDDDVILDKNYLKANLRIYDLYEDAKGVQGYIINWLPYSTLGNAISKICFNFPRNFFEKDKCRTFPFSYPHSPTRVIECEWLIGANSSYKKEVLKEFEFDENLKDYSMCEDIDFSYRISKKYGNSLYLSPYAKIIHKQSSASRTSGKKFIIVLISYSTYFFYKDVRQSLKNNIIFYWGFFVGRLIPKLLAKDPNEIWLLIKAELMALRHWKEIKKGDFDSAIQEFLAAK